MRVIHYMYIECFLWAKVLHFRDSVKSGQWGSLKVQTFIFRSLVQQEKAMQLMDFSFCFFKSKAQHSCKYK